LSVVKSPSRKARTEEETGGMVRGEERETERAAAASTGTVIGRCLRKIKYIVSRHILESAG